MKMRDQERSDSMATKSVLKSVNIKNRSSALALVRALENAHGKKAQEVAYSRTFSDASRDEIKKMFGEKNDGVQGS